MRFRRRQDTRYGRNPLVPYHMRFGRKTRCEQTGFPTYEDRLVTDEWGLLVDPRYGGYDTNETQGLAMRRGPRTRSTPTPTGGGTGGGTFGEAAQQSDALVDAFGTQSSTENDFSTLVSEYAGLHTRLNREAMIGGWPSARGVNMQTLWHTYGIKTLVQVNSSMVPADVVTNLKHIGVECLAGVEGLNEPDHDYTAEDYTWAAPTLTYSQNLWTAVKADGVTNALPILGPAWSKSHLLSPGDYSGICDYGNCHLYDQPYDMSGGTNANYANVLTYSRSVYAGKPLWCTEYGFRVGDVFGGVTTTEQVQAKYVQRSFLDKWWSGVFAKLIQYQFRDSGTLDSQDYFGIVKRTWVAKPAYNALSRLLGILSDANGTFTPGSLAFTLAGTTANLRHLVLQKRDGRFLLVLWLHIQSNDTDVVQSVTVTLGTTFRSGNLWVPQTSDAPVTVYDTVPAVLTVLVPDYPVVVELVP